jgi:predicted DNA-binding transcriptional regulator AlpA
MRYPWTYTAHEVSVILQIPVTEVYRGGADGTIPGRIRIGRRTRFAASIIDDFVAGRYEEDVA